MSIYIAIPVPGFPQFFLTGQADGTLGEIVTPANVLSEAYVDIDRIVGPCTAAPQEAEPAACSLSLASPVRVHGALLENGALRDSLQLATALAQVADSVVRTRFLALVAEGQRRLQSVDVDYQASNTAFLGVTTPFGGAAAFASANVKLELWSITSTPGASAILALKVHVAIAAQALVQIAGTMRPYALVVVLDAALGATLRIDLDDFALRLPSFELPSFDLRVTAFLLTLKANGLALAESTFRQFGLDTLVNLEHTNPSPAATEPRLCLKMRSGQAKIDWAVVTNDFADSEDLATTTKIATFKVTTTQTAGPLSIAIDNLQLGDLPNREVLGGVVVASMAPIHVAPSAPRRLGPFEVSWKDMTITPSHQGNAFGGAATPSGPTLRAVIAFDQLTLRVRDDADAFLTFDGKIEIDPSGARLLELALVAPFPIVLLAKAADAIVRGGAAVVNLLVDFGALVAEQAAKLLDILGRMALAAGRAAIFVAEQAWAALGAVGDLLAKGLAAVGEMLGELLRQIGKLLSSATPPRFALELRIATQPFELRQVLITSRENGAPSPARIHELLGLRLEVPGEWQPGLLLDFVSAPGAYLILSREAAPGPGKMRAATLSTDLWLDSADAGTGPSKRPLRDVDGAQTAPADRTEKTKPLLSLGLDFKTVDDGANVVVVLAGLSRGQPVFFQRMAGKSTLIDVPGKIGVKVRSMEGPITLLPLEDGFDLDVGFEPKRILPLLGMGESGNEAAPAGGPSFLEKLQGSLSNVIWVKDSKTSAQLAERSATVHLILGLKAAGLETSITLKAILSLDTLSMKFEAGNSFPIASRRIEESALGLLWVIEQADPDERAQNTSIDMFALGFAGGQSGFELNSPKAGATSLKGKARMQLRFGGLSSDGQGIVFEVATFKIGAGGLDLVANVACNPVRLNGIDVPFQFTQGSLEIKGGRLVSATVAGRGALPPDLIGEADCTVALTFGQVEGEGIVLQSGKVELDKKNDPIICHAARFTLTISDLDIAFVKDGGYHFYYLVTGSLRFSPKSGEFESGLLQYLDGVEMNLERTPLSSDPRVLMKHITFQKTLNPKKSFNLFNLFTFELRGFGYHPASPKFDGAPAVNISGQIKFVEIGDVMQPSIDFHGLWIAPPAKDQSLPRIKADGLGIDLNLKGAIRVRGAVIAVDENTTTVEGKELAPEGYNAYGFLGRGEFDIPGWGSMGASLGFLELESKERPGERRKSFYFYAEKRKMAIEIPTVIWNFYLREFGFGLGFRYTLEAIAAADRATSIPKLINTLDEVAKTQGDLHKFSAWKPEAEGDRVTLALKGVIQVYPANKSWDEDQEKAAQNPFLFDLVAVIRSDFTLFMGLRGWVGVNYIDYLNDKDGLRANPGLRGYLFISAPQQRLLARMIGNSKGYIGDSIPALAKGSPLRSALQTVDWSATLFIKPGLFHYELGWPNQLVVRLMEQENMRVTVRGGMIFRAADDGLLWAYNIEADAYFHFSGALQIGPVGICAEATLTASLVARVLCYLSWRFKGSLVYGLISLDARLEVAFRAWMEIDLGLTSFTLRIGFTVTLQFSAAIEIAISTEGVGARVQARVAVSVFGCTLSVALGFVVGQGQLDDARARVQRFMAMSITAEEPDAAPAWLARSGDERMTDDARHADAVASAPAPASLKMDPTPSAPGRPVKPPSQARSHLGHVPRRTDFWCVMRRAAMHQGAPAPEGWGYAALIPQQARLLDPAIKKPAKSDFSSAFYAAPSKFLKDSPQRDESHPPHILVLPDAPGAALVAALAQLQHFDSAQGKFVALNFDAGKLPVKASWNKPVKTEDGSTLLTLAQMFDECYLSDTLWHDGVVDVTPYRQSGPWQEPEARIHLRPGAPGGGNEDQKNAERDKFQRGQLSAAEGKPVDDAVHQARSTVLGMFADQFVSLADSGAADARFAHVTDIGLVFYGPVAALEQLGNLKIHRNDLAAPEKEPGQITTLNPLSTWFDLVDPTLAADRSARKADGIKLDWVLQVPFVAADPTANPEHFLQHYEVVRTVEGQEFTPRPMLVKACATLGPWNEAERTVSQLAPEWQLSDDLADLAPEVRRALLPANGEADALAGALSWAAQFGSSETVSLSYTVTPVDIAGSRGLPKSFLVDVPKPVPRLRPAEAELRFVVKRLGAQGGTAPHHGADMPLEALGVVMGLKDASMAKAPGHDVERYYVLYADPENISPSGHYGTDGLTERRLGMAASAQAGADARAWRIDPASFVLVTDDNGKVPPDTFIDALEPDHDTLATYPHWALLAGSTGMERVDTALAGKPAPLPHEQGAMDFLASLWRRNGNGARIATRFTLVTVQVHTTTQVVSRSQPVPVSIEVRVEPTDALRYDIGLMRPEAFEWPVHLEMPPHRPGQVRASTGFARFRAPSADARLDDLLKQTNTPLALVRDPERRVMTTVSFDAAPLFDDTSAGAIDALHARCVAGFDLHELDLDDLAPLDTAALPVFESNPLTWQRARRVARIERVSTHTARLLPDANKDWPGWQAHYPSETWRLQQRADGRAGQSAPHRAAWYSAAESTIAFARRVPRLRLFSTASEAAVADLLAHGEPWRLQASMVWSGATESAALVAKLTGRHTLELHQLGFGADGVPAHLLLKPEAPGAVMKLQSAAGKQLSPAQVRAALLALVCRLENSLADDLATALADGTNLLCSVSVSALDKTGAKVLSTVIQPVTLSAALHPVLEEVIGELEYSSDHASLYRRYVVSVQPVQPVEATTMPGFLANTAPDTDPYGWGALQQLGLASTIRLYDRDLDQFLSPHELLLRVRHVFESTVARYRTIYAAGPSAIGQPFVEVLLRPGQDRVAGPFDAVLASAGKELEAEGLELDDAGLSLAQLSLRPVQVPVYDYHRLDMTWEPGNWPQQLIQLTPGELLPGQTAVRSLIGYEIEFEARGQTCELLSMLDGQVTELAVGLAERLPVQDWKKGAVRELLPAPGLQFFLRVRSGSTLDQPAIRLKARVRTATSTVITAALAATATTPAVAEKTELVITEKLYSVTELFALVDQRATEALHYPSDGLVSSKIGEPAFQPILSPAALDKGASPYERFAAINSEQWAQDLMVSDAKGGAFRSLRMNLRFAAPALAWPKEPGLAAGTLDQFKDIAAVYVPWTMRYLAHGAALDRLQEGVHFALAAPIKANPLNLAADAHGQIVLSFLHADRWAHARVYAVRPSPRYQNLALGAGYFEEQAHSEQLLTEGLIARPAGQSAVLRRALGYALAASPRTERIEPPVFLGSRLVRSPQTDSGQWELVLARHGEEGLAFSNRSLFARLGTEGTALSFVREYRDPDWPARLNAAILDQSPPKVELYPERLAALPAPQPDARAGIDGADLQYLAGAYPSLWKGADVWRVSQLAAHYRVTALAVARAGLVVSRVVTSVQDATPRRPLNMLMREATAAELAAGPLLGKPTLRIKRGAGPLAQIRIEALRMVSHADLSEASSHEWFKSGSEDVAWWPDPNVRYTLLRRGTLDAGASYEDEEAELNLVAKPLGTPATDLPEPIVLRCRGTRFVAAGTSGDIRVKYADTGRERAFTLAFGLQRRTDAAGAEQQRLRLAPASDDLTSAFNAAATAFARIDNHVVLAVGPFDGAPAERDAAQAWLRGMAMQVGVFAAVLQASVEPALLPAAVKLAEIGAAMQAEADGMPAAADYQPLLARIERLRTITVDLAAAALAPLTAGVTFPLTVEAEAQILTLHDLPTSEEAKAAAGTGHAAADKGGQLWAACRARLLGAADSLAVRAVDGRNAIEKNGDNWSAPGETDCVVTLPEWAGW
ncbi:hypothetical protein [Janthinobacterium sp. MDT1-19]|uniref:hypothetical protein n=1 Tax=Janthinobacterium sp. MDT1-19 TaxID=1259339 RepID=UPI003F273B40